MQVLYLYVNSAVLMASAEIGFREAMGANFFIAGTVMLFAALLIAIIVAQSGNLYAVVSERAGADRSKRFGDDRSRSLAHRWPRFAD